jgi:hypothetical protein
MAVSDKVETAWKAAVVVEFKIFFPGTCHDGLNRASSRARGLYDPTASTAQADLVCTRRCFFLAFPLNPVRLSVIPLPQMSRLCLKVEHYLVAPSQSEAIRNVSRVRYIYILYFTKYALMFTDTYLLNICYHTSFQGSAACVPPASQIYAFLLLVLTNIGLQCSFNDAA